MQQTCLNRLGTVVNTTSIKVGVSLLKYADLVTIFFYSMHINNVTNAIIFLTYLHLYHHIKQHKYIGSNKLITIYQSDLQEKHQQFWVLYTY